MKTKITKEELRKIAAGVRREVDLENNAGLNRHYTVEVDKKKKQDREKCRKKELEE
jgi:hypothetical protein